MEFYKNNAKEYAQSTFDLSFSDFIFKNIENKYLKKLNKNKPILEIGCGSGRDALYLTKKGYNIIALDQSFEIIEEAKRLTNLKNTFYVGNAQDFEIEQRFDFIYSIACLLHLNNKEFAKALMHITSKLTENGIFFFFVKKGTGENIDSQCRYFNYFTEEKMMHILNSLGLKKIESFEQPDVSRPDVTWIGFAVCR